MVYKSDFAFPTTTKKKKGQILLVGGGQRVLGVDDTMCS